MTHPSHRSAQDKLEEERQVAAALKASMTSVVVSDVVVSKPLRGQLLADPVLLSPVGAPHPAPDADWIDTTLPCLVRGCRRH